MISAYTPQQNGVAERKNMTFIDAILAMSTYAKLPKIFWEEALLIANYFQNKSPTKGISSHHTLSKYDLKDKRVFLMQIFLEVQFMYLFKKNLKNKLDPHSTEAIFWNILKKQSLITL